ncbi:LysM peptidoglycan-binding domain-containing protein [Gemmobacter serpentinus]|uniref:LysM peptidoglycan-binding domain-containing protein n=1 Tax=Gemmobacter serpentinus TaxID=2652247 RepID=UPI00124C2C66|nr:LysM peptidoglycan-binding domain-containing protein [Gemmobacter serpentinus]
MIRLALLYLVVVVGIAAVITGVPWVFRGPEGEPVQLSDAADPMARLRAASDGAAARGGTANALGMVANAGESKPVGVGAIPLLRPDATGVEQTTAAILQDLALLRDGDPEQVALQRMSSGAIAALNGLRGQTARPVTLEGLVAQALREGQTDAYIDALVNEAAGRGEVSVPAGLVTASGKVDTAVLLAGLVSAAQAAARADLQPARHPALTAPVAGTESRIHLVQEGDSLGAIALKFYGNMALYPIILEANRATLSGPDRLRRGQELRIPVLKQP